MEAVMVSASTGVINSVLDKLATLLEKEYRLIKDVKKDITFLRDEMSSMNALLVKLCNMEELDVLHKDWRDKVRELAYDTEDCIDIFMHKIGDSEAKAGIMDQIKSLKARYKVANIIEELKSRVVEVSNRRNRYKLDEGFSGSSGHHVVSVDPRVQALYIETSSLVGIDEPRNKIIKWLMEEQEGAEHLKVVSIVGSGGMGKTTLANQIYMKCKKHFDSTAFIAVSKNPNLVKILMHILSEVGYRMYLLDDSERNDERQLIDTLRCYLKHKRYLIVIDDIWSAEAWNIIKCSFVDNNCSSRVITTTRIESVAKACCSCLHDHVYMIKPLSDQDARKLFHRRVLVVEDACPDELKETRDEIIKRCRGVPLAILSVASILASHEEAKLNKTWDMVRNSLSIQLETNPALGWMRHVLNLSYNDLSPDLKTCMLYLGIFPEDYIIMKEDLIKRWVAEGFVCEKYGCDQDEVAESYFNELINRSMLQIGGLDDCGEVISCRVHDVMLDFITSKSTEENFLCVINDQRSTKGSFDVRRLSVQFKNSVCDHVLRNMALTQVRSFNFWGPVQRMCSLSKFQLLRVLSLDFHTSMDDQYDMSSMCNLFQLRYLMTRGMQCTKWLPQLQKLQHLKTLEIFDGDGRGVLQLDVRNLSSGLRHLNVPSTVELIGGIRKMRALRTLATLRLTDVESIKEIGELGNIKDLKLHVILRPSCKENFDFVLSSLYKLGTCNLQSLTICVGHISRHSLLSDILTSWSPPPYRLQRLHVLDLPILCCSGVDCIAQQTQ